MLRSPLKTALTCLLGLGACVAILLTGPEPLEASLPAERPAVTVGPLERSGVAHQVTAFGILTPPQTLRLTTQVPGEVTWVSGQLIPGGSVAAGDLLFRIDERDYQVALASAEARHAQALANVELEKGRAEIAQLEWAAWQRVQGDAGEASPLALREPQRADAAARLRVIGAELDRARLALERTAVRAPWAATVVQANTVPGQVLAAGDVTATLFPVDFGVVEVQVPVGALALIDGGLSGIELRPVNDPAAAVATGTLEGVVRNLTTDTRLATVRVRIDQPLDNDGWAYGMHLQAMLVTRQSRPVASVPSELIVGGNLVWIHRDGRALRHQVQPLRALGERVSVVDDFEGDDALIVERPIGLFDGAAVDVSLAEAPL